MILVIYQRAISVIIYLGNYDLYNNLHLRSSLNITHSVLNIAYSEIRDKLKTYTDIERSAQDLYNTPLRKD